MNFYHDVLSNLPLFNSPSRVASLDYLEPITRAAVINIIVDAKKQGIILMPFETYRSQARQQLLFQQGATQLEDVGVHGFGLACDLVKEVDGEPNWKGDFSFLAILARKHGLVSGLDWGQSKILPGGWYDACHVQRVRVQDQPQLFEASWYPPNDYSPYKVINV